MPLKFMKLKAIAVVAMALLLSSCYGCPSLHSRECRSFFDMPREQRNSLFRTYPIEKQIKLYHCGMGWEPPYTEYAYEIAKGGERNIPFLLERLRTERSQLHQTDIIYIFRAMSVLGHLHGRQDIVVQLEQVVAEMWFGPVKEKAERHLQEIRNNIR